MTPAEISIPHAPYFTMETGLFPKAQPVGELDGNSLTELRCPQDLIALVNQLNTPDKIQKYLDGLAYNPESDGVETTRTLVEVSQKRMAHCFEGGIGVAYPLLALYGYHPRVVVLQADNAYSVDHNIIVYRTGDRLGAVAQSRLPTLKSRPPIFPSLRHLIMTYYHHYTADYSPEAMEKGLRCLLGYSDPISLEEKFDNKWYFTPGDQALNEIYQHYLDGVMCTPLKGTEKYLYPPE